ncbi:Pyrophosphate-energized membrane proton pump 3, partial [Sarracenia purpurea var. burkii]
ALAANLDLGRVEPTLGEATVKDADLFESITIQIISAMILGGTVAQRCKIEDASGLLDDVGNPTSGLFGIVVATM